MSSLLDLITKEVSQVKGITAVVLGGSRARGTHTSNSDYDIGIYYNDIFTFDWKNLDQIAMMLEGASIPGRVNEPGDWGPWINGGGWLQIANQPVDFLYRDLNKVEQVLQDNLDGKVGMYYQPGHPFGFCDAIYTAELATCKILWDPYGEISALKKRLTPYPLCMAKALVTKFLWEAEFSASIAEKAVARNDSTYAVGCGFRAAMCLAQTLFALNGQFWLNEKGAIQMVETFESVPFDWEKRVTMALAAGSAGGDGVRAMVADFKALHRDVAELARLGGLC